MRFKSFRWLSHQGLGAIKPCSTDKESVRMISWGFFIFIIFSLVFYILGVFLIKQLFH